VREREKIRTNFCIVVSKIAAAAAAARVERQLISSCYV